MTDNTANQTIAANQQSQLGRTEPTAPQSVHTPLELRPVPPRPSDTIPIAPQSPLGYVATHVMEFVNGILHQVHQAPHTGDEPAQVLVPVPGRSVPEGLLTSIGKAFENRVATVMQQIDTRIASEVASELQSFEKRLATLEQAHNNAAPQPTSVPNTQNANVAADPNAVNIPMP